MKTIVTVISMLVLILSASACRDNGSKTNDTAPPAETAQPAPESAEATPPAEPPDGEEAAAEPVKHDFRMADWGMSMEQVMELERDEPNSKSEDTLDYQRNVLSMAMLANFKFINDKLVRGGYVLNQKIEDNNEYIEKYNTVKEAMIKAEGPPVVDAEKQINPDAEIDPDHVGDAICRGDMIYGSQWNRPDGTVIRLILNGKDSMCYLTVIFSSPEFERIHTIPGGAGR